MNDNDFNEMIKKAQAMIQNNQIPDDIKALVNNLQNSNSSFNTLSNSKTNNSTNVSTNNTYSSYNYSSNYNPSSSHTENSNSNYNSRNLNKTNINSNIQEKNNSQNNYYSSTSNEQNNTNTSNIDLETLMKIQNIMSKMKDSSDDDMSKLLLSLKPYLRNGKKEKIDEYIQLIKMGKMTQLLDLFGGEKK